MGGTESLRHKFIKLMVGGVGKAEEGFDEDTGCFLSEGRWAVTNQDIIYPLALLYRTSHPDNDYHLSERVFEMVLRGGDALRERQYEDGSWEFVKLDRSRWGRTFMPWTIYHWLEAFRLVREELGSERLRRWEEGLRVALEGAYNGLIEYRIHNIPTWHAMTLIRAGEIFEQEKWSRRGLECIRISASAQRKGGYWAEFDGPTTNYNLTYAHAISLAYRFTGDDSLLESLKNALEFHMTFTYPDGSVVETIDGRVKYHKEVRTRGFVGYSFFPDGRRYIRFLLERCTGPALEPAIASAFEHIEEGEEKPIPHDTPAYTRWLTDKAMVRREKGWFFCLSGITLPSPDSRWGMDRTHFLSIFNDRTGLIIGGGNSKGQPEWSSFNFMGDCIPVEGKLLENVLELKYRRGRGRITVSVLSESQLLLQFERKGEGTSGFLLRIDPEEDILVDGESMRSADVRQCRAIAQGRWRVELSEGSRFRYPVEPFNPYAKDGSAPPEQRAGIVSCWAERLTVQIAVV